MFGIKKNDPHADRLQTQVHVVAGFDTYRMASRLWNENQRTMRVEPNAHKEFMRFAYTNPSCTVWLQRDEGREGVFELVVRWETDKTHEVFVLLIGDNKAEGDDERAKALLNSMLTTPSVVLSSQ